MDFGGMYYDELDDDTKENLLSYDIFVEIVNEKDDHLIYDLFARLNTNNYVLNRQEVRNSKFWGEFKVTVYNFAAEYRDLFLVNGIFKDKQFSRMDDAELISILLNLILTGITSDTPASLDKTYETYDNIIPDYDEIEYKFATTMKYIQDIYVYLNGNIQCFTSKTYFYTLFAVTYHQLFGILHSTMERDKNFGSECFDFDKYVEKIVEFEHEYDICIREEKKWSSIYGPIKEFADYHRTRTTNKAEREIRIAILNDFILGKLYGK